MLWKAAMQMDSIMALSLSLSRWPCCQNVGNYCFPHFPIHWCIMQNIHFFHCSFLQNMFCWSLFSGQESNNIWCDFLETALSNQRKKTTELQWLHCKRYWACNRGHANNYIGQRYLAWHCVSRMHLPSSIMWKVFDCDLFHVFVLQGLHMKTKRNIILKIDSKPQMKSYTGWKTCLTNGYDQKWDVHVCNRENKVEFGGRWHLWDTRKDLFNPLKQGLEI